MTQIGIGIGIGFVASAADALGTPGTDLYRTLLRDVDFYADLDSETAT